MKKLLVLAGLSMVFSGCGSGSDPASTKDLFSSWAENGTTYVLDLSRGAFGTSTFTETLTAGAICGCTIAIGGTQSSGNAVMSGCTYQSGGSGDPGCAALDASYTYSKTNNVLTICQGSTCHMYN